MSSAENSPKRHGRSFSDSPNSLFPTLTLETICCRKRCGLQRGERSSTRVRAGGRDKPGEGSASVFDERTTTTNHRVAAGTDRQQVKHLDLNILLSPRAQPSPTYTRHRRLESWMSFEELFSRRSYYLLVALTSEGQLIFEEDREGSAYGVRLNDRNFLNGARHSVYYDRDNNTSTLLVCFSRLVFTSIFTSVYRELLWMMVSFSQFQIDREPVPLLPIPILSLGDEEETPGATEIQLGGLNTTDPRFSAYKGYTGCLSSEYSLCG